MAKDRITIFIPNINLDQVILNESAWIHFNCKGNWSKESKYARRIPKYRHGTMRCKAGCIDVECLKYSPNYGDMLFSLSISEIYFFSNAVPKSVIDANDLANKILSELKHILDTSQLPSWDTWKVTRDETNLDIIDSQENIERRMEILSKSQMPYRRVDNEFFKDGSVYFRGRTGKKSASQFIAYDKIKENFDRKGDDLREVLGLTSRQGCLRLELKTCKDPLKRNVKLVRQLPTTTQQAPPSNFSLILSEEFQASVLIEAITKLNLDKIITTREKLLQVIDSSTKFTERTKNTALQVVKHVNGERYSHKLNKRTISKYANLIFSTGYHVLYSDVELKAITPELIKSVVSSDLKQIKFS